MKIYTTFLALFFVLIAFAIQAQNYNDFSVTLVSPQANETLYNNSPVDLKFLITNKGQNKILTTDTIWIVPTINGNYFTIQGQIIWWFDMLATDLMPNQSDTVTAQIFPSFTTPHNNANLCAVVFSSYDGVTLDTIFNNNTACIKVNISANGLAVNDVLPTEKPQLYPNPATNTLYVQLPAHAQQGQVTVYDYTMRKVLTTNISPANIAIDVSRLPQGIYYIGWENSLQKIAINN